MKKEPKARANVQRPGQRETKEVLAELVEKLKGKLEVKATSANRAEAGPRGELSPNLDRLTVAAHYGIFCQAFAHFKTVAAGHFTNTLRAFAQPPWYCVLPSRNGGLAVFAAYIVGIRRNHHEKKNSGVVVFSRGVRGSLGSWAESQLQERSCLARHLR